MLKRFRQALWRHCQLSWGSTIGGGCQQSSVAIIAIFFVIRMILMALRSISKDHSRRIELWLRQPAKKIENGATPRGRARNSEPRQHHITCKLLPFLVTLVCIPLSLFAYKEHTLVTFEQWTHAIIWFYWHPSFAYCWRQHLVVPLLLFFPIDIQVQAEQQHDHCHTPVHALLEYSYMLTRIRTTTSRFGNAPNTPWHRLRLLFRY